MTFVGLAEFGQALRPDAAESVASLRGAGCRVVMVSATSSAAAAGMARSCGVLDAAQGVGEVVVAEELLQGECCAPEPGPAL